MLRSERQSCSWRGLRGRSVEAVIADQFTGISGLRTGREQIALYTLADALNVLGQSGVVESIAIVGFSRASCLCLCRKAFDNVELLLD